jgi:hypothetical protein
LTRFPQKGGEQGLGCLAGPRGPLCGELGNKGTHPRGNESERVLLIERGVREAQGLKSGRDKEIAEGLGVPNRICVRYGGSKRGKDSLDDSL